MPLGEVNLYGDEFNSLFRKNYLLENSTISFVIIAILCLSLLITGVLIGMYIESIFPQRSHFKNKNNKTSVPTEDSSNPDIQISPSRIITPKHIAVIMDGNRRFGKLFQSDNPFQGHMAGGQTLVDFCDWCMQAGTEIVVS